MKKLLALAAIFAAFSVGTANAAPSATYTINFTIQSVSITITQTNWTINHEEYVLSVAGILTDPPETALAGSILQGGENYLQGVRDSVTPADSFIIGSLTAATLTDVDLNARVSATTGTPLPTWGTLATDNDLRTNPIVPGPRSTIDRVEADYLPVGSLTTAGGYQRITEIAGVGHFTADTPAIPFFLTNWFRASSGDCATCSATITVYVTAQ